MIIDIFQDALFQELKQYNKDIIEACKDIKFKENQWWFNPARYREYFMFVKDRGIVNGINKLQDSEKYNLILHPANYLAIFLINRLYSQDKHILIEDICCGMGNLVFYLAKCGYNFFSLVDDFSQVPKNYTVNLLSSLDIKYISNKPAELYGRTVFEKTNPIVVNMVGYHTYPKQSNGIYDFSNKTELVCLDADDKLFNSFGQYLLHSGFVVLCEDFNNISMAFCKRELYNEFITKI